MYIAGIRIKNYKSYLDSEKISFTQGFNVIVGANNVGKTALLDALSLKATNNIHRSLGSNPTKAKVSLSDIYIGLNDGEIFEHFGEDTYLTIPHPMKLSTTLIDFIKRLSTTLAGNFEVQIGYEYRSKAFSDYGYIIHQNVMELNGVSSSQLLTFQLQSNKKIAFLQQGINAYRDFPSILAKKLFETVYMFNTERRISAKGLVDATQILNPDASNLVSVLHDLSNRNPTRFQKFFQIFKRIFPEIHAITMPTTGANSDNNSATIELMLWNEDPDLERPDLAFSLAESGTGIGQVLAMLYVVLTAIKPLTLIIDEPQSFLHPGAIRKLFEIFKQYQQHQYIVTTHSPTVVAAADPDNILLVTKEGSESKVQQIKKEEKQEMERVLHSVGASLSDVFGADNILWVEGPTEEKCFPLILRELKKRSLFGTVIQGVVNTGDLTQKKKKNLELVKQIYDRLSQNVALMPSAIGFIFDNEGLDDMAIQDLERHYTDEKGVKRLALIPRKMYENYLLNAEAIAFVLSQALNKTVNPQIVQSWLSENQKANIKTLDGAKLIQKLFLELSDKTLEYDKIYHGYQLTLWLIENRCLDDLQELADFLDKRIEYWQNS